jgi:hypothetical protein
MSVAIVLGLFVSIGFARRNQAIEQLNNKDDAKKQIPLVCTTAKRQSKTFPNIAAYLDHSCDVKIVLVRLIYLNSDRKTGNINPNGKINLA